MLPAECPAFRFLVDDPDFDARKGDILEGTLEFANDRANLALYGNSKETDFVPSNELESLVEPLTYAAAMMIAKIEEDHDIV